MKKIALLAVLAMAITFANAQDKTTTKSTTKTTPSKTTTKASTTTKTKLDVADYPKEITDAIETSYPGYKILDGYKLDNKGVETYEFLLEKGSTKIKVFYDKDFKFTKKETVKPKAPGTE